MSAIRKWPDAEAARSTLHEAAVEAVREIAAQTKVRVAAVRRLGPPRNRRQTRHALATMNAFDAWCRQASAVLRTVPAREAGTAFARFRGAVLDIPVPPLHGAAVNLQALPYHRPASAAAPVAAFRHAADTLTERLRTVEPQPLPVLRPPGFARLREGVLAETVDERIAALLEAAPHTALSFRACAALLDTSFLTREVGRRFAAATEGFSALEHRPPPGEPVPCRRLAPAYTAVAADYLLRVREALPAYAEHSGQTPPYARHPPTAPGEQAVECGR
ncbi:hypothetical protein ACH4LN_02655 [Streptomyces albus]|uniref:hypothetical protein n=1 Tax=Streptomyces albus TaxID=1888 RepID=UPI00379533F3